MATGMTDAEYEEQMRGTERHCYVCAVSLLPSPPSTCRTRIEHDAAVALAYLADPDAAEIRLA